MSSLVMPNLSNTKIESQRNFRNLEMLGSAGTETSNFQALSIGLPGDR